MFILKVVCIFVKVCVDYEVVMGMVYDEVCVFYKFVIEKLIIKGVDFFVMFCGYYVFVSVVGWVGMVCKNEVDEDKNKVWCDVCEVFVYCVYVLSKF